MMCFYLYGDLRSLRSLLSMAPIGWTNWSTRIVIHQHWFLPIIPRCRLILSHVANPRPRIPTNLNPTCAPISHRLLALGTSHISCRSPQSLRKVCIIGIRPCFLLFELPSANVLNRIVFRLISHDDIVRDLLPIVKVGSVDHELVVHVEFVWAFARLVAYAITNVVGHCECVLHAGDADRDLIRRE